MQGWTNVLRNLENNDAQSCPHIWISLLKACISMNATADAKRVHEHILRAGIMSDAALQTALMDLCAKSGNIGDAVTIFLQMPKRDVVTWNVLIAGYARLPDPVEAFEWFWKMMEDDVLPNDITFLSIFKACSKLGVIKEALCLHQTMIELGVTETIVLRNTLINMYGKCGSMEDACILFESAPYLRSRVTWTAIISGYCLHGNIEGALQLLWKMIQQEGVSPDAVTFLGIVSACADASDYKHGLQVHAWILLTDVKPTTALGNALINMYIQCGCMDKAHQLLANQGGGDVVTWTSIIVGYLRLENLEDAFKTYEEMQQQGVKPNEITYINLLNACAILMALCEGKQIHNDLMKNEIGLNLEITNALVGMYSRCGCLEKAEEVLDHTPKRDSVTWSALIAGYAKLEQGSMFPALSEDSPSLFTTWNERPFGSIQQMQQEGFIMDAYDLVSAIKLCSSIPNFKKGGEIHCIITFLGMHTNVFITSALIDLYVKCGEIEHAKRLLKFSQQRDVVLWTSVITGYAQHGLYEEVWQMMDRMESEGIILNDVSFLAVLSACSHAGLIDEGCWHFRSMVEERGIVPRVEHYTCLVDLLSRAGRLGEAEEIIIHMNCRAEVGIWLALLGGCRRSYCHLELAEHAVGHIFKLASGNIPAFLLLESIYAMRT